MFSTIYVTAKNEKEAEIIAKYLLNKKMVACANLFPIKSFYHWEGKLQKESEYAIILKTRKAFVEKTINEIKKKHSYDVPCIISFEIKKGDKEFLHWIQEETK